MMLQANTPHKPRLLVLDEDRIILQSLGQFLRREGYEVHTTDDPAAAQSLLEAHPIEVLLADINMAGIEPGAGLASAENVPSPLPLRMLTVFAAAFTTAMSTTPLPVRSSAAIAPGPGGCPPEPPKEANTRWFPAGAITIGLEYRDLDPQSLHDLYKDNPDYLKEMLEKAPEGGFTDEEVELGRRVGWRVIGLGPRILRVETAAMVLAVIFSGPEA